MKIGDEYTVLQMRPSHDKRYLSSLLAGLQYGILWAPERFLRHLSEPLLAITFSVLALIATILGFFFEIVVVAYLALTGRLYLNEKKPTSKQVIP